MIPAAVDEAGPQPQISITQYHLRMHLFIPQHRHIYHLYLQWHNNQPTTSTNCISTRTWEWGIHEERTCIQSKLRTPKPTGEASTAGKGHCADRRLKEWKLSINALYSSYLPMASNQTIKDRPHQRQWWVGRVSLVSTYLPVLNPGRWKQKNNWPMIPAAVGRVRSTAPNINNTISP